MIFDSNMGKISEALDKAVNLPLPFMITHVKVGLNPIIE